MGVAILMVADWGLFPDKGAFILINFMKEAWSSNEGELELNVKVINGKHHGGELWQGFHSTQLEAHFHKM